MPVLKQQQAAPKLKDAIVLDLGDVARQAQRIREQARQQAEQITRDAEQRAQQLIDGAEEKGREQGYQAGHEQGLAEGREQGRVEALGQMQQQLDQVQAAWSEMLQQWAAHRQQLEAEARQNVIEFAVKVAEKLVYRVVEVDHAVVVDQVAAALSYVLQSLDVAVRTHPDDRALLEEALPDLARQFTHLQHIELVEDDTLDRGGCKVSFGQGEVNANLRTQIDRIVQAMLPSETQSTNSPPTTAN